MTRLSRGLAIAAVHCLMVMSIAGKYAYDRERLPRTWAKALPYDPNLPIRGRYVRFTLEGMGTQEPLAYFIPDRVPDPSRRPPGEELWVEVSVPRTGPPRPIRLGVKKDGVLRPLDLR
ncbi:MAG TPA: hypothetical protein VKU19_00245 [Bryobacteraceae bacterium]|nr:hypothetical protein [Bryobacteraceae bacterium]